MMSEGSLQNLVNDKISDPSEGLNIAVLIPCYDEGVTIRKVIKDFQEQLPKATIYVYDNNSSDGTFEIAKAAGAVVAREKRQGKGFVVASMFQDIEADIYILVDGDDTYPHDSVNELIHPIITGEADMVVANRLEQFAYQSFRRFHIFGNRLVVNLVNMIFGSNLVDIMSGYRAFNNYFVKNIPIVSKGFEVEIQMTLQALYYDFVIVEIPVRYGKRPEGSHSKLNTFSDGLKLVLKIFDIFKAYRPLLFFFIIGFLMLAIGISIGSIPFLEYIESGRISHFPSVIIASGFVIISVLSVAIGMILDAVNHRMRELMRTVTMNRR